MAVQVHNEISLQKEGGSKDSKKKRKSSSWMTSLRFRWISQISFFILTIYVGWMFYLFVRFCETGGATVYVSRPPGVEAFLPIGAFMGLKYFLGTGQVDPLHPAGFVIFASILVTSLLFQRGFCSWICPVGTMSEWAWRFGDWIKSKFNKRVSYWLEKFPVKLTCGLSMITTPIVALMLLEYDKFCVIQITKYEVYLSPYDCGHYHTFCPSQKDMASSSGRFYRARLEVYVIGFFYR